MDLLNFHVCADHFLVLHIYSINHITLIHTCRWVVVHGMGGCGKTVLAAEVVRDKDIILNAFPGEYV